MALKMLRSLCTTIGNGRYAQKSFPMLTTSKFVHIKAIQTPKPGGKQYRRLVHYPEDKKYTVEPLNVTHLAGRDPVTGRVVAKGIGGGVKHKFHWVQYNRDGPSEGPPKEERVLEVMFDGHRTGRIALVASGDELKYIIATENMKAGDIIKTSRVIPRIPVRGNDGDAYPLGALEIGTRVHCIEKHPGFAYHEIRAAGTSGTILRKFEGHVVVRNPRGHEIAYKETCMATVGRVSNIHHGSTPIGSVQKNRELGNRPRSGLWQRKTGKHGRKIRKPPPMKFVPEPRAEGPQVVQLTLDCQRLYRTD